jgi:hypothetical protein
MPLYDRDYYSWRAWIDRKVKYLLKEIQKTPSPSVSTTTTLTVVGWVDNFQTVAVVGVTADNNIIVSPPIADADFLAYGEAKVRATSQGAGTITFTCTTTPTVELIANIIILG